MLDHRVGVEVAHQAQGVAEVARPKDQQHQERPRPPHTPRVWPRSSSCFSRPISVAMSNGPAGRRCCSPGPARRRRGLGDLALEQVVDPIQTSPRLPKKLPTTGPDRQRRVIIDLRRRADHVNVGLLVEPEGGPVEGLQGSFGCPPDAHRPPGRGRAPAHRMLRQGPAALFAFLVFIIVRAAAWLPVTAAGLTYWPARARRPPPCRT